MSDRVLLDTDVVIDHLRGQPDAVNYIVALTAVPFISVIVVGELYAGVRDGSERNRLVSFLDGLTVISLDPATAVEGGLIRRSYGKSHGVGFNDAMIAATAKLSALTLVTLNRKHFPMLTDVLVPYQKA